MNVVLLLAVIVASLDTVVSYKRNVSIVLRSEPSEGQAIKRSGSNLWPTDGNGYIYYSVDYPFDERMRRLLDQSMTFWQKHTCLSFMQGSDTKPVIRITADGGACYSTLGRQSIYQRLSLGWSCGFFGTVVHEVGHTLGLGHEHQRYDRDAHISINYGNVDPGNRHSFNASKPSESENFGLPYDYGSIMHYDVFSSAVNRKIPVLIAHDPLHQSTMGQQIKPSFLDLLKINKLYQCERYCQHYHTPCQNQGFPNPKNCHTCICPWGFGGRLCEARDAGQNASSPCGADLQAGPSWTTLQASVGVFNGQWKDRHDECHWHIKARPGRKVHVWIKNIEGECSGENESLGGCALKNIELKLQSDMRLTGYRFCCNKGVQNRVFASETELAIVSRYSLFTQRFEIAYREG